MQFRRLLVAFAATTALTAGLALSATPAHAEPVPQPLMNQPDRFPWHNHHTFSKTASVYMKRAEKVTIHNHSHTLDYRKAKKYFGSHTLWRREFAAGWMSWNRVAHISSAERRRVKAVGRRFGLRSSMMLAEFTPVPMRTCTGRSKTIKRGVDETLTYMNSCQTTHWLGMRSTAAIWIGFAAGVIAIADIPAGLVMGTFLAVYATRTQNIQNAQNDSGYNAVIVESHDRGINYTNGTRYVSWRVVPQ